MRLEDQFITIDQAIRIRELGVSQESLYYWSSLRTTPNNELFLCRRNGIGLYYDEKGWFDAIHFVPGMTEYTYSAFTVAELGLMLPDLLETHLQYELVCIKEPDEWLCRYVRNNDILDMHPSGLTGCAATEAEARAEMLISLLDNNIITVEEVNHRLSPSSDK